ncbi:hypothetical protein FOC1_g10012146, partial [Fusarium oxysporum f. sp. cubense race 1]
GLFNQYVNPISLEAITWKYYLVFIAVVACQLVIIYFIFPETKGSTVEEVRYFFLRAVALTRLYKASGPATESKAWSLCMLLRMFKQGSGACKGPILLFRYKY